jgi:hypothetical protein
MHDSRSYRDNAAQCLPSHGSRSPVRMRQWTIYSRAGTCPRPLKAPETRALRGRVRKPPIAPTMRLRGPFDWIAQIPTDARPLLENDEAGTRKGVTCEETRE